MPSWDAGVPGARNTKTQRCHPSPPACSGHCPRVPQPGTIPPRESQLAAPSHLTPTASPAFSLPAPRYPSLWTQEKGKVLLTPASPRQSSLRWMLGRDNEADKWTGLYQRAFKETSEPSQVVMGFSSKQGPSQRLAPVSSSITHLCYSKDARPLEHRSN